MLSGDRYSHQDQVLNPQTDDLMFLPINQISSNCPGISSSKRAFICSENLIIYYDGWMLMLKIGYGCFASIVRRKIIQNNKCQLCPDSGLWQVNDKNDRLEGMSPIISGYFQMYSGNMDEEGTTKNSKSYMYSY